MFVDLRLRARGRVHDSGRRPAGAPDLDEVEGDGRLTQAVPDGVAVAPADEPAGKHWHVEGPQSARDVYALAARERDALRRPVSVAERQARDDESPVHGGVESYGQDHLQTPPLFPGISSKGTPTVYYNFSKDTSLFSPPRNTPSRSAPSGVPAAGTRSSQGVTMGGTMRTAPRPSIPR